MYPDRTAVPPLGKGLNKPATIVFLNWTLPTRYNRPLQEYKDKLKGWAESKNATFNYYDPNKAEFSIKVQHF